MGRDVQYADEARCCQCAGASTLYVHDHRSNPPLRELLTDYIDAGIVQYVWWEKSWDNWNYTLQENPQMVRTSNVWDSLAASPVFLTM